MQVSPRRSPPRTSSLAAQPGPLLPARRPQPSPHHSAGHMTSGFAQVPAVHPQAAGRRQQWQGEGAALHLGAALVRRVLEKPRACSACRRSVGGQRRAAFPAWGACPWQRPEVPSMSGLGGDPRPHPRASSWHGVQGGQWAPSARRHCSLLPPGSRDEADRVPKQVAGSWGCRAEPRGTGQPEHPASRAFCAGLGCRPAVSE